MSADDNRSLTWVDRVIMSAMEAETLDDLFTIGHERCGINDVVGREITINDAAVHDSEYGIGSFAQIDFTADDGFKGWFSIGGHAASLPVSMARSGRLPIRAILRKKTTRGNRDFYKWELL